MPSIQVQDTTTSWLVNHSPLKARTVARRFLPRSTYLLPSASVDSDPGSASALFVDCFECCGTGLIAGAYQRGISTHCRFLGFLLLGGPPLLLLFVIGRNGGLLCRHCRLPCIAISLDIRQLVCCWARTFGFRTDLARDPLGLSSSLADPDAVATASSSSPLTLPLRLPMTILSAQSKRER